MVRVGAACIFVNNSSEFRMTLTSCGHFNKNSQYHYASNKPRTLQCTCGTPPTFCPKPDKNEGLVTGRQSGCKIGNPSCQTIRDVHVDESSSTPVNPTSGI